MLEPSRVSGLDAQRAKKKWAEDFASKDVRKDQIQSLATGQMVSCLAREFSIGSLMTEVGCMKL